MQGEGLDETTVIVHSEKDHASCMKAVRWKEDVDWRDVGLTQASEIRPCRCHSLR